MGTVGGHLGSEIGSFQKILTILVRLQSLRKLVNVELCSAGFVVGVVDIFICAEWVV